MFEHFTEKARRAIFFARYETSRYGSPYIETEHLLLGLMREDWQVTTRFLKPGDADVIRKQIEARGVRPGISTSVDLPLSHESKRVLAYAAEESERLGHRHIGTEHLLLGLLREEGCFAAELLRQCGLTLENLREELRKQPNPIGLAVPLAYRESRRFSLGDAVEIHSSSWDADYIRYAVWKCREHRWHWQKQPWAPRDIAIHRGDNCVSFDLRLAENAADFELVKSGWKKDCCLICRWELFDSNESDHSIGYTNGRDWLCTECYDKFFARSDFFSSPHPEIT